MTELLERAIARVRALPDAMQDDAARMLLRYAGEEEAFYRLTPEEEAEQDAADAEETRGDYATDEEVRALWAKHGL
ncbi:hypothetical protein [Methylobacterium sp. NFXW15]|uniref:hypothetical protein n=1 Tax=Methylobacterium sp. NFXW15 TaxID=2819512 RepID=UPI003CEA05A3